MAHAETEGFAGQVIKDSDDRRYTLCVAYPADRPDVSVAADGYRDFASKAAVEDAAWNYMRKHRNVGLWHEDGTDGAGEIVESYIAPADFTMKAADGTEQVIKAGDWLVGIVWSEKTWPLIKQRLIGGVSMQGTAKRRKPSAEAVANLRSE